MFVRTDRLLLRPGWIEDAATLVDTISDQDILTKLEHAPCPYGIGDAEAFLKNAERGDLPQLLAYARTQGAPRLVGGVALNRNADGEAELGYWIARRYWGLGFATEAASALLALARQSLRLSPIAAGHFVDNPASGRVLRKLGFVPTGDIARRPCLARHGIMPYVVYEDGARRGHTIATRQSSLAA